MLTPDEIRFYYNEVLTRSGYIDILKGSISKAEIEQVLDYAEKVNKEACHQLDNDIKEDSPLNLWLIKIAEFKFPAFPDEQTKHFDYSNWDYKEKLIHWFETSMRVIGMLNGKNSERTFIDNIKDASKGLEQYNSIMAWFSNNGFCDPVTYVWKSDSTTLANYLKILHSKGYTKHLSQMEILNIAKNSFGHEFSRSLLNKAKGNPPDKKHPEIPSFKN